MLNMECPVLVAVCHFPGAPLVTEVGVYWFTYILQLQTVPVSTE